jgi:RNA polymerase sigma factor (sigma-70 family)
MEISIGAPARGGHASYVMAVVLGTALSVGQAPALAAPPAIPERTVQDLSRYCTACWRNARLHPDCWGDCTQEVLRRLLERVRPGDWEQVLGAEGEERKEFLRAIDTVKKRTQRQRKWSLTLSDSVPDRREVRERRLAEEREAVRRTAAEVLSPRQQRILQRAFEGCSVQEIATELKLPAERVSDEKYKAIRKLREHLASAEA